ncbi:MAG: FecR domain-containing protein, partial [Candidatus Marinimicrobia bacterium]|nr:FecR domain-containing protein [Candidatus Neomarinimicrobiota bacterium]
MKKISTHIILLAMIFIIPSTILSAEKIAALLKLKGNVLVKQITSKEYTPAYKGQMLLDGDWIKTGDGDFAAIIFLDGTQLKLSEAAELELRSERISAKEQNTDLFLAEGELWTKVKKRKRSDFNIATPVSVAAVKGTEFNLNFNDVDKTSELFVFEGSVEFQNDLGKILAKEMTYSIASIDKAPKKPKKMKEKTLPDWQNNIKVDWGFQLIPEKSGRQPVNVPLKVGIQVNDLLKGTVASNFSE